MGVHGYSLRVLLGLCSAVGFVVTRQCIGNGLDMVYLKSCDSMTQPDYSSIDHDYV